MALKLTNIIMASVIAISCTMLVYTFNYVCSEIGGTTAITAALYV